MIEVDLGGRAAVVTGGSRGIGLACAHSLARAGADVVLVGRRDAAEAVAAEVAAAYGVRCIGLAADARSSEQIQEVYRTTKAEFGRLDVLVNSAGILQESLIGMISDETIDETLTTNTAGPIRHMQAGARLMRKNGGSIINVSSIMARAGDAGLVVYSASKAAVIGMTLSAARELAPRGVRVNAVAPGFILTDMTAGLDPEDYRRRVDSIAMGRPGTPEDVAHTVLWLASDLSLYVTGQVVGVDGGMRA